MKPIHIVAGLGATLIVGLAGWYMYMQQTPPYERTYNRGLPPGLAAEAAPADPAEAPPPSPRQVAAEGAADAPTAAPAADGGRADAGAAAGDAAP